MQRLKYLPIEFSCDWTTSDIDRVRYIRKQAALVIQNDDATKDEKKQAKRKEKAATIVIDAVTGNGKFSKGISAKDLPEELRLDIQVCCAVAIPCL